MLIKNEFVCDETGKLRGNSSTSMCTKWHFAIVNVVGVGAVARKLLDADKLVNNVILFCWCYKAHVENCVCACDCCCINTHNNDTHSHTKYHSTSHQAGAIS